MLIQNVFASQSGTETGFGDYMNEIFLTVWQFGGLPFVFTIAAIVLSIIGFIKLTRLRPFWDSLGRLKPLAIPLLSLTIGIISLAIDDTPLTIQGILAYLFAGSGAIILHDVLDAVKALPGISPVYFRFIESLQGLLRRSIEKRKIETKDDDKRYPRNL